MESPLMISHPKRSARSRLRAVLPTAVGPTMAMSGGLRSSSATFDHPVGDGGGRSPPGGKAEPFKLPAVAVVLHDDPPAGDAHRLPHRLRVKGTVFGEGPDRRHAGGGAHGNAEHRIEIDDVEALIRQRREKFRAVGPP